MAKSIKVDVALRCADVTKYKTDLIAVGVFSNKKLSGNDYASQLDGCLDGMIKRVFSRGHFKAQKGQTTLIYPDKQIKAKTVMLVGLGDSKKADKDVFRVASAKMASKAVDLKVSRFGAIMHHLAGKKQDTNQIVQAITEGIHLGGYRFDEFVSDAKEKRPASLKADILEAVQEDTVQYRKALKAGNIIGKAQSYGRQIANSPANVINPTKLVSEARKMAQNTPGLSCKVFDQKQLTQKKMGGVLAVGQGSDNKPAMIVLKYMPGRKKYSDAPVIGLVGKAITFDSGGISIKPSANMDQMKLDKGGGVAVLAAMKAIAQLKPAATVYGIICAAENMPGSKSYRPGDIITTYSGKTVEVLNTDAEGRLVLADGIHFASRQKCDVIVDIATLTGACMVALGDYKAGLFTNSSKLQKSLMAASENTGEPIWHLPCGNEYLEDMKSEIADLRNTGKKRWGGASTAASFLSEFAGETDWAHIDIAGAGMRDGKDVYGSKGVQAFGVRLLTDFVVNY